MHEHTSGTVAASGRELALLAFVGQQIDQISARDPAASALVARLRAACQQLQQRHYLNLLRIFHAREDWRAVRNVARALARRNPTSGIAYQYTAVAAMQQNDDTGALAAMRRAVALGDCQKRLLYQLSEQYGKQGWHAEAVLALRAAAKGSESATSDLRITYAIQAEQQAAEAEAARQQRPRGRALEDNETRLSFWLSFLQSSSPATAAERELLMMMRHAALNRRRACQPFAPEPARTPPPPTPAAPPATRPASAPEPTRPPRKPFRWDEFWQALFSERILHTVLNIGALLVVVSAFIWMAFNWTRFSAPMQMGALAGMTATFYVSGALIRRQGQMLSGTTLIAIGAAWVAVLGWAGARLAALDPLDTWLVVSLLCLPIYMATTLWLRAYLFSLLSGLAGLNVLLAALNVADIALPWQGCAVLLLLAGYLLLAQRMRALPNSKPLAVPLVWLAHGGVPLVLLLAALLLLFTPVPLLAERLALALAWWLGAGFYLLALRLSGSILWEQTVAWVVPVALLLSAEASNLIAPAWYGTLLLLPVSIYLWLAHWRKHAYTSTRHPWLAHRAMWPVYNTPHLLAVLALVWPNGTPAALLVNALGATALYAYSARLFRHPIWAWLACGSGLLAGWHLSQLLRVTSLDDYVLLAMLLGVGYWLAGVLLERIPRYGLAPLASGGALLAGALALAFLLEPASQRLLLPFPLLVSLASTWLLWRGQLFRLHNFGTRHRTLLLAAVPGIAVALLAGWLELLLLPRFDPLLLGASKLLLAAVYLLIGWRLSGDEWRLTQRMLNGAMVALTVLSVLPLPEGMPVIAFAALLVSGALACLPIWHSRLSPFPAALRPIEGAALVGGVAALILVPLSYLGDDVLLLLALLANTALYLLTVRLYRSASGLYVAGGTLTAAWMIGLGVWQVPLTAQGAWLSPLALLLCAWGLALRARTQREWALTGYLYGYGAALVSVLWCVLAWGAFSLPDWQLSQNAIAVSGLTVLAVVSSRHFRQPVFASLAVTLPAVAYLFALDAHPVPPEHYGLAITGLALVYLALLLLHRLRRLTALDDFRPALLVGTHALAVLALLDSGLHYMAYGSSIPALVCALLASGYALAAGVLRRPIFVAVAAVLASAAATLAYIAQAMPLLSIAGIALLWLALAAVLVALGLALRPIATVYRAPLYSIGLALAALAPLWALPERPLLLSALAGLILLCLYWQRVNRRTGYELLDLRLARNAAPHFLPGVPLWQAAGLLVPVAVLVPLWVVLLADLLEYGLHHWGLALALIAPVWLVVSCRCERPDTGWPFRMVSYLLPPLALLVAGGGGLLVLLMFNSVAYLGGVALARTPHRWLWLGLTSPLALLLLLWNGAFVSGAFLVWYIPASYIEIEMAYLGILLSAIGVYATWAGLQRQPHQVIPAAAAVLPAIALFNSSFVMIGHTRWLEQFPLWIFEVYDWLIGWYHYSLLYVLVAGSVLVLAWWLDQRHAQDQTQMVPRLSDYTLPLYTVAAVSGLLAWCWEGIVALDTLFAGEQQSFISVLLLVGVAGLWTLYARRFYEPRWLYLARAALIAPYLILLNLLEVPNAWYGVALLPGVFAGAVLSYALHIRTWTPAASSHRLRWLDPGKGIAWALPGYILSGVGSLSAVVLSLNETWPLTVALAGAAVLYGSAAWVWRSRRWFAAALVAAQLSYAALLWARGFHELAELAPLWLGPGALLAGVGLWLERRLAIAFDGIDTHTGDWYAALRRLITPSWVQPVYLAALVDVGLALLLSLPQMVLPETTAIVAWSSALLLALLASIWKDRALPFGALLLTAHGLDSLLLAAQVDGTARLVALALLALGCWWVGQAFRWQGGAVLRFWSPPLQQWALAASGAAVLLALIPPGLSLELLPPGRVLAINGLLYVGKALVERRLRLSYLGSGLLVLAWMLHVPDHLPDQPQFYAIPAGIYLLAVGAAERWYGAPERLAQALELLGMGVLLSVTFWQSLPHQFNYALLLGLEALLILFWGVLQRVRLLFFGGSVAFLVNLGVQSVVPAQSVDKALLAFGLGMVMVVIAVYIERQRAMLRTRFQQVWEHLESWH